MNIDKKKLDETDVRILRLLQSNGRISMKTLGQQIAMSPVAAADRVARLEDAGVIRGYGVRLSHSSLGRDIHALVLVDNVPPTRMQAFQELIRNEDRIVSCYHVVTGGKTAMLDIFCESVEWLSDFQTRLNAISPTYTYLASSEPLK